MTKSEFISRLDDHYANMRRLATSAKHLIEDIVRKNGNMSYEYLYGFTEDNDTIRDCVWLDDGSHIVGIESRDGEVYILTSDDYGSKATREVQKTRLAWI